MAVSVFDLFKIGMGPSSSHTIGPMRAARRFALELQQSGLLPTLASISVTLYGSLALTGRGHGTDRAVLLGLCGEQADTVNIDAIEPLLQKIYPVVAPCWDSTLPFDVSTCAAQDAALPQHPNGMVFRACAADGGEILKHTYFHGRRFHHHRELPCRW